MNTRTYIHAYALYNFLIINQFTDFFLRSITRKILDKKKSYFSPFNNLTILSFIGLRRNE